MFYAPPDSAEGCVKSSRIANREVRNIKAGKQLARAESKFLRAVNT